MLVFGLLLLVMSHVSAKYNTTSAPIAGKLNVHLISHSHDDVGWLKTAEQYYSGANDIEILPSVYYAVGAVDYILDSVVLALSVNPDRKFVVVEQYYFRKWFESRSATMQGLTRGLVKSNQLQFANGGLVMHDEACPTYVDMLDQTTAGNRWIVETFGMEAAPRVTSQLDPFGHSATQSAYLSSPLSGYVATFFARMDYEEAAMRARDRTPDFVWEGSVSLGDDALTLAVFGVQDGYGPPDGLCFDISIECYPFTNPINDDGDLDAEDVNVVEYVQLLLQTAHRYAETYPKDPDGTVHVPFMMGSDFQWEAAHLNFGSLDKLVHYVNLNTSEHGVNVLYSSPADYAAARLSTQTPLTLRTGSAFPYADSAHSVWSGYFTSRPALKGYIRETSGIFQAMKQLQTWSGTPANAGQSNPLWLLETAMGVNQHHDAVTGTSKQIVAFDYAKRLAAGRTAADKSLSTWLNQLLSDDVSFQAGEFTFQAGERHSLRTQERPSLQKDERPSLQTHERRSFQADDLSFQACDLANATICPLTEAAKPVVYVIYNAQAQIRSDVPVRIPVPVDSSTSSWRVLDSDGTTPLVAQLLPTSSTDEYLRTTYYSVPQRSMSWLAFRVPTLPAMGYATVFLEPVASHSDAPSTFQSSVLTAVGGQRTLSNGDVTLSFDSSSNLLESFRSKAVPASQPLVQNLFWYASSAGDAVSGQASGAYILRVANGTAPCPVANGSAVNLTIVSGPVVSEARQTLGSWASQVFRLWANQSHVDVEWTVGSIPETDFIGKEVISRYDLASWQTRGQWSSDSNAREMQNRTINQRTAYHLNVTQFTAQNYGPVNTAIRIQDSLSQNALVLLTDRTQGGGSTSNSSVELMLHRRIFHDDGRGVLEPLNEPGVDGKGLIVRGLHRLILAPKSQIPLLQKTAQQDLLLPPLLRGAFLPSSSPPSTFAKTHNTSQTFLAAPLPNNVQLVTVHKWNESTLLVRLSHLYEIGEDPILSKNVTISLRNLFRSINVKAATETTAIANMPITAVKPVTYKTTNGDVTLPRIPDQPSPTNLEITISAMQVRTFLLEI